MVVLHIQSQLDQVVLNSLSVLVQLFALLALLTSNVRVFSHVVNYSSIISNRVLIEVVWFAILVISRGKEVAICSAV